MPVHKYSPQKRHDRNDLVERLVIELLERPAPRKEKPEDVPHIYVEKSEFENRQYLRVSVIWNKWEDVPDVQRAGVIMDAIKKAWGSDVDNVTMALGLTASEAEVLGLNQPDSQ